MAYFKKLIGDRIYLSPRGTSEEEIEKYTEWLNDFQITDYINFSGKIITYNYQKDVLEKKTKLDENTRAFNIIDLQTDKLIGKVGLRKIDWLNRNAIFGIYIGENNYRSNGYGTEATNLILEYGFKYLNLHSITLTLIDVNEQAHKCYLKCGFKDTGRAREQVFVNGKYYDRLTMDILENEFSGDYIRNKNI